MTRNGGHSGRRWIAVHAIWLLLVQAALGGFVAARAAVAPAVPLCAAGKAADPGDRSGEPADLPACCLAGCVAAALLSATLPDAISTAIAPETGAAQQTLDRQSLQRGWRRTAHAARAPPL